MAVRLLAAEVRAASAVVGAEEGCSLDGVVVRYGAATAAVPALGQESHGTAGPVSLTVTRPASDTASVVVHDPARTRDPDVETRRVLCRAGCPAVVADGSRPLATDREPGPVRPRLTPAAVAALAALALAVAGLVAWLNRRQRRRQGV
jgi:hypothetical protein